MILGRHEAHNFDNFAPLERWHLVKYWFDYRIHYQDTPPPPIDMWHEGFFAYTVQLHRHGFIAGTCKNWKIQRQMMNPDQLMCTCSALCAVPAHSPVDADQCTIKPK